MCQVKYYKSRKMWTIWTIWTANCVKLLPLLLVTLLYLARSGLVECQLPRLNASRVAEINRIPWKPIKNPLNRVGYIHSSASELRSFTSSEVTNGNNNNHNNDGPNVGTAPAVVQHRPNGATVGLDIPDSNIRLLLDIDELAAKSSAESLKFKVHNAENQVINTGPPYSAPLSVEGNQNNFLNHQPHHRPAPVNPSIPPYVVGSNLGPFPLPSPTPSSSNKKYQIGYVRAQDLQAALNTGIIPPGAKAYPVPPTANLPLPIPTQQPNNFNSPPLPVNSANGPASFQASGQYMVKYSQPLPGDGSFATGNSVDALHLSSPASIPSPQPSSAPQTETTASGGLSVAAASPSKTNTRPNSPSALAAPVKNARKKQQSQQSQQQQQQQRQAKKSSGKKKQSSRGRSGKLQQASTTTSTTTVESTTSTSTAAPVFFREEATDGPARLQQQKTNQQQEKESDEINDDVQIQQQYQDADEFDDEIQAKLTDASKASSAPTSTSVSPTTTSSTTTSTTTESNPSAALQEQQEDQLDSDEEQRQPASARATAAGGKGASGASERSERERLQAKGQQQSTQQQQQGQAKRKSPASEQRPVSERLRSVNSLRSTTSDSSSDEEESNANNNNDEDPDDMDDGFELLRTPTFMGMGSQEASTVNTCSPKSASLVSTSTAESLTLKEFASKIGADAIFNKLPGVEEQLQSMADFANSGYTLFLPSNDAIERMPKSLFNKLKSNPEEIKKLLDNHVSDSKRDMNEMARSSAFMSPRAASAKIKIARGVDGAVLVNGQRVTRMNQKGPMGGSVHVIDGLLYPVADKNVMETLKSCNRFDGFVTLAEGTGLGDSLSSGGPFTVFVPSNEALQKIPDADLERIRNNMTALKEFLMYHVAQGAFYSSDLRDGQFIPSLIPDQDIQVGVRVDGCSRRLVEANVSPLYRADIPASNGVIHVIDWILKPNDRDWCEGVILPRRR